MDEQTKASGAAMPDVQEIFERFRLPNFDVDGFVASRREDIDAMMAATQSALAGAQTLAEKQTELLKSTLSEMGEALKTVPDDVKAPTDALTKQRDLMQSVLTRTLASMREMAEAAQKSQTEIYEIATDRMRSNAEQTRKLFERER